MLGAHSGYAVIEVSPSRIEVALVRGRRVIGAAWRRIEVPDFESNWPRSLGAHERVLAELVNELRCRGHRAVVLLDAPGFASTICACPATFGESEAESAAMLAVGAIADFPIDGEPCIARVVHTDAPSPDDKSLRNTHLLAAAQRAGDADAVAAFVERAGLIFAGAAPVGAVALLAALKGAAALGRRSGDRSAVLWIGEHESALASVVDGAVKFVRPVAIGIEALVDALRQQPQRSREDEAEVELDRIAARQLLAAAGVPAPDAPLPGHDGLTGAAVLPIIQPALQRITIETKQSLRFGLSEKERSGARLQVEGPGAAVPGLGDWIARQCGLAIVAAPPESPDLESSSRSGAIAALVSHADLVPLVLPRRMSQRRTRFRARVALAAGIALAGALLGWEWRQASTALQSESARLEALLSRAESDRRTAQIRNATLAARLALAEAEARAMQTAGEAADNAATLAAIAAAAKNVRISSIHISRDPDACVARISGFVRLSESEDPATDIRAFVDSLSVSPIAGATRLSATQRVQIDGAQSQAFEVALHLVRVPILRDGLAVAREESVP
jgi:Tfp pilus assembly PilM family ATPase